MDRAQFLGRTGLFLGALAVGRLPLDPVTPAPVAIIQPEGLSPDEILRRYYLPPVREMLNSPSILLKEFE